MIARALLLAADLCASIVTAPGQAVTACRDGRVCVSTWNPTLRLIETACPDGSRSESHTTSAGHLETAVYDAVGRLREICVTRKGEARAECWRP